MKKGPPGELPILTGDNKHHVVEKEDDIEEVRV